MAKDISYWKSILIAVALMVGGWAVFSLVRLGVGQLLAKWGVANEATQYIVIIFVVVAILLLAGFGVKAAIKKLIK